MERMVLRLLDKPPSFSIREIGGGLPNGTNGTKVIRSVFAATKEELSEERVQEISQFLPGKIQEIWEAA